MKFAKVWFVVPLPELVFEKSSAPVAVQNVSDAQDIDDERPSKIDHRAIAFQVCRRRGADSDTDSPTQE